MVRMQSDCVGCSPDLPCIGASCTLYGVYPHHYCDRCGNPADYEVDGEDYCADCLKEKIDDEIEDLSLNEKLEMLDHIYRDFSC